MGVGKSGVGDLDERLCEVLLDFLESAERGVRPEKEFLLARHPELAPELEAFLETWGRVDGLTEPIRSVSRAFQSAATVLSVPSPSRLSVPPDSVPPGQNAGIPFCAGYDIQGELGRGGMGVVYRAFDRRRRQLVALKVMGRGSPDALYRFKKEFRTRADLTHPNLVNLYELVADAQNWFFTMELVDGETFLRYARHGLELPVVESPPRTLEDAAALDRLRAALRQLASAIAALHEAGKLHRDLKPGNVLVNKTGRVVVLDFGLATEARQENSSDSTEGDLVGTVAYMAPEQAAGRRASPASDWYSVGVILYEALTGRRPFEGTSYEIIQRKQDSDPPQLLVPSSAEDLATLCARLLRRDPSERPTGEEILRRLEAPSANPVSPPPARQPETSLVGRESHLAALASAFTEVKQGKPAVVFLSGKSGVGKSALAQRFLDSLREQGDTVVLEGQCFEQESVPYKAFDGIVDMLSRLLGCMPPAEREAVVPRGVAALLRVFPVLRRAIESGRGIEIPDPQELRRRAFAGLSELLGRLGDRRPLVLCIDDLQWGDADSAAVLTELLQPPDPPMLLFVLCYRSEEPEAIPFLRMLVDVRTQTGAAVGWRELAVDPLSLNEARDLAVRLLGVNAAGTSAVETIARESGGNPFFVHELARAASSGGATTDGGLSLQRVLLERIQRLPETARDLLAVISTAVRPIALEAAFRSVGPGSDALAALAELRSRRLVRSTGTVGEELVAPYHDRVRETVAAHLSPEEFRNVHRQLARTLEATGHEDPETLAVHFRGAGEAERAGHYFARAADAAAEALAFDQAARLYRQAFELRPVVGEEARLLRTKLGDALANGGRGAEAAEQYIAAASGTLRDTFIELQCRAAQQYLLSGHVDEGISIATAVLREIGVGLPATPRQAILSLVACRLWLWLRGKRFRERPASSIAAKELDPIDVTWGFAIGLSAIDPIRGAYFQARNLLLALRAGEPYRVARSIALEAIHVATAGTPAATSTRRLLEIADSLAKSTSNWHATGLVSLGNGVAAYLQGRWRDGAVHCKAAESVFREQCVGTYWESNTARAFGLYCRIYLGELHELVAQCPSAVREAQERGDLYGVANVCSFVRPLTHMVVGEPETAFMELDDLAEKWSKERFHVQHANANYCRAQLHLYQGDGAEAVRIATGTVRSMTGSLLVRVQHMRFHTYDIHARACLAYSLDSTNLPDALHQVERDASRLEREKRPDCQALALVIRAAVAWQRRQLESALRLLSQAIQQFEAVEMKAHAAAARRRLGQLVGGDKGRELIEAGDAWMTGQGVRNPVRMTRVYAPGFRD
jgi:serine/threonine protein kinase